MVVISKTLKKTLIYVRGSGENRWAHPSPISGGIISYHLERLYSTNSGTSAVLVCTGRVGVGFLRTPRQALKPLIPRAARREQRLVTTATWCSMLCFFRLAR